MQEYLDGLEHIVSKLFAKYSATKTFPGVLLSGGVDSSTISYLVSRSFPDYFLFSMGTEATKDRTFVEIMAAFLKHNYRWVELTDSAIREAIGPVVSLLKKAAVPSTVMQVSLAVGYYLIFKAAHEAKVTHIFTGQGPDITYAGYHKYKTAKDIQAEIRSDLPLLEVDKRRDGAMARHFGITLINPYLEKEMVDFALSIPAKYKLNGGTEKYILRKYAEAKGLPAQIVARPKKAFQYSTGLQRTVAKYYNNSI